MVVIMQRAVSEYLRAIARSRVIEGEPGCDRMAVPCSCCTVMLCRKSAVIREREREELVRC